MIAPFLMQVLLGLHLIESTRAYDRAHISFAIPMETFIISGLHSMSAVSVPCRTNKHFLDTLGHRIEERGKRGNRKFFDASRFRKFWRGSKVVMHRSAKRTRQSP